MSVAGGVRQLDIAEWTAYRRREEHAGVHERDASTSIAAASDSRGAETP